MGQQETHAPQQTAEYRECKLHLPPNILVKALVGDCVRYDLEGLAMISRSGLLGIAILTFLIAVPADAAPFKPDAPALKPNRVDVEYVPPKSSAHEALYKLVRERRLLEKIRDLLAPIRLPRRLLLKARGCDGEICHPASREGRGAPPDCRSRVSIQERRAV
jgi:hypothetical protein